MNKPEPIVLSVNGIAPKPITMNEPPRDWRRIVSLPPFQMFAREHGAKGNNALQTCMTWLQQQEPEMVWADYCDWFAKKGLWQNETPDGRVLVEIL
jgi:hypothetical protein